MTLSPCSNPYFIRTILFQRPYLTRLPGPRLRSQWPLPNTANLALNAAYRPAKTTEIAAKTLPSAPIQPHYLPNSLLELAETSGNEREIDFSALSKRN